MDKDKKDIRKPTVHSMKRRSVIHDYFRPGYYHVTLSLAQGRGPLLGRIAGRADRPDGDAEAPHVELSAIGRMVEQELTSSISRHYPMIEVQDYVVMPEHLHFLLVVHRNIVSKSGRPTHLGQVMAGFKYGCNRRYWALTGRIDLAAEPPGTVRPTTPASTPSAATPTSTPSAESATTTTSTPSAGSAATPASTPSAESAATPASTVQAASVGQAASTEQTASTEQRAGATVLGGSAAKEAHSACNLPPLFEQGYVDVMPVDAAQLEQQRRYIHDNPRSRLLRTAHRAQLQPQRMTLRTALSVKALKKYLLQVCHPSQIDDETWQRLEQRLLTKNGIVVCDSYGSVELAERPLLPVVCHRRDKYLFSSQKQACMEQAAAGAVLVSPRIAAGEQEIIDAASGQGFPVIVVADNGFPEIYHPSQVKIEQCMQQRLLLVSPWKYRYRAAEEDICVAECKAMNCVAQALCRTRDDWWKKPGG